MRSASAEDRGKRGLDLLNFFLADAQTGFGPFVAVYLTTRAWTQAEIGFALTLGTVTAMISQVPAGMLVDAMRRKRAVSAVGIGSIGVAALLLAAWPIQLSVAVAQVLHGAASCVMTPAIAALSLTLVGHAGLGERLGRNARFAAIGNGLAAALMGLLGSYVSERSVFIVTAALCVPAMVSLLLLPSSPAAAPRARQRTNWSELATLLLDRRLLVFAACIALFHLSNAAMLPIAAGVLTMREGPRASLIIAACIVVPQAAVALLSPWVGRSAGRFGRRRMLLLGWAALPLRGVLLALLPAPWLLVAVQAISGISGAVFGVMLPLIAADVTQGTSRFSLAIAIFVMATLPGAALSTVVAGWIADQAGESIAFIGLAAAGLAGTLLVWLAMPETRET